MTSIGQHGDRGAFDRGTSSVAAKADDLLEEVLGALPEGLLIFDENAVLRRLNYGSCVFSPGLADIIRPGVTWDMILREAEQRTVISGSLRDRLHGMETRLANGDAMIHPIEIEAPSGSVFELSMLQTSAGGFVVMQKDITERRRYEENQREVDGLLRRVLEACPANIVMSRVANGEIIYRTPAATELLGTSPNALEQFASRTERGDFITALLPSGRVDSMLVTALRADGTEFPGLVSARLIDYHGEDVVVSTTVDVSKEVALRQKLAEQREQIFSAEKMSALGELLAGVAHELNNPLSVVVGHALMLREEEISPEVMRRVEKISDAAERCAKIVKTFLAMARQQPTVMAPIDIAETVRMAIDALTNSAEGLQTRIETDIAAGLPPVRGDGHQIAQVIINLITNADQAIRQSGTGDRIRVVLRHDAQNGAVEITVADNGPGINEKIQTRIFDPLFTTKPVGTGTGIGLALCHRIVTAHAGSIRVKSDSQGGAVFVITLPVTSSEGAGDEAVPHQAVARSKGRILVVDDEDDVAELIREILVRDGFDVEQAHSAESALTRLETRDYALILTDLNMPGMGGRGLYERLSRVHPRLARRIGFVTGDTMSPQARGFLDGAGRPFLEKPISPAELRKLARSMLENRG